MVKVGFWRLVLILTIMSYMLFQSTRTAMSAEILMKIYFIPFAIETYVPVTESNIEDTSIYAIWFTQQHPFISRLHKLLQSKRITGKMDNRVVRLKVEFVKENEVFYVDRDGIVAKDSADYYKLSQKAQNEIESEIKHFSGVVDIKAKRALEKEK